MPIFKPRFVVHLSPAFLVRFGRYWNPIPWRPYCFGVFGGGQSFDWDRFGVGLGLPTGISLDSGRVNLVQINIDKVGCPWVVRGGFSWVCRAPPKSPRSTTTCEIVCFRGVIPASEVNDGYMKEGGGPESQALSWAYTSENADKAEIIIGRSYINSSF